MTAGACLQTDWKLKKERHEEERFRKNFSTCFGHCTAVSSSQIFENRKSRRRKLFALVNPLLPIQGYQMAHILHPLFLPQSYYIQVGPLPPKIPPLWSFVAHVAGQMSILCQAASKQKAVSSWWHSGSSSHMEFPLSCTFKFFW